MGLLPMRYASKFLGQIGVAQYAREENTMESFIQHILVPIDGSEGATGAPRSGTVVH